MIFYEVLFLLFITSDFRCRRAIGPELVVPEISLLVTSSFAMAKLRGVDEMETPHISTDLSNRQRRIKNYVRQPFTVFVKRLWDGIRLHIEGKVPTSRKFAPERVQRLMKLSIPTKPPIEFVSLETTKLPQPTSSVSPMFKKYPDRDEIVQATANGTICRYFRQKWKHQLISEEYDETQPVIVNYVKILSDKAIHLYKKLDKRPNRWYLWQMKPEDTPASDLTTQFQNIYELTLAYGTNGTTFYGNRTILMEVIDSLEFMVKKKGYNGEKYHGYWWHWLIGVPESFTKILIIIYDELRQEQRDSYVSILNQYVSNPLFAKRLNPNINIAAYTSSLAESVLALGILQEDEESIRLSRDAVVQILKPSIRGDNGFYPDGSFTHNDIPYTGLYGKEMIKSVAQILFITKDSDFDLPPKVIQDLVDLIERAFIPLIFDGEIIAPVCGRAISRAQPVSKTGYGSTILYDFLIVSKSAPKQDQKKIQEAVKFWLLKNPMFYLNNTRNYNDISMLIELMRYNSIVGDELPFSGTKLFASMDRFVQRTPDYMMGLSLYSNRISAFDTENKENKRGWHTSDGMVYLYNEDEVQFNVAYWPTVDPFRLPGTTIDTVNLFDEVTTNVLMISDEKWVGGVAADAQAVVGMSLNKKGSKNRCIPLAMDLQAKKSWFIVEGQIVALGAGITGNTKASLETVVDNRLLNDNLHYELLSNEGFINKPAAAAVATFVANRKTRIHAHWVLLYESSHKASIGYYFPTKTIVDIVCERRTGKYPDINEEYKSTDTFAGNYSKILIRHGRRTVNASYAYVIVPGVTKELMKGYGESNPVIILANTGDIQAVQIKDNNYVGINIWKETGGEVAGISSNKPASILKLSRQNEDTYVVSDPTQTSETMQIKIPEFTRVVSMDEGVEYDGAYDVFVINCGNSSGRSFKFTVIYDLTTWHEVNL